LQKIGRLAHSIWIQIARDIDGLQFARAVAVKFASALEHAHHFKLAEKQALRECFLRSRFLVRSWLSPMVAARFSLPCPLGSRDRRPETGPGVAFVGQRRSRLHISAQNSSTIFTDALQRAISEKRSATNSAARALFLRKRKSIRDLAMSQECQKAVMAA